MQERKIAKATIDAVAELSADDRDAMFRLMDRYYSGMSPEQFGADLDAKQHLIRMFDTEGVLCGFSTLQRLWVEHGGREHLVVFSGDTVIDEACWGQKHLQNAFVRYLIRTWFERPGRTFYWFLISKGFKTYLLMRNNFASWPNHKQATPSQVQTLLDAAATKKYPEHYDAALGLIRFPRTDEAQAVKGEYLELGPEELKNPDIRFFAEKNPEFAEGDELCCLARVNLRAILRNVGKYGVWHPVRRVLGLNPKRKPREREPSLSASSE